MKTITPEQRKAFATKAGTSVGYLYLLAGGHRNCRPKLAREIESASGMKVSLQDLRPDIFGSPQDKVAA